MRRFLLPLIVVSALLAARAPLAATDDLVLGFFGDYLESLRAQAGIPGMAAAIVGANGIIWERYFGERNVAQQLPTDSDSRLELDGLMQLFDAAIVLRCVDVGHLSLDDPIQKFDPNNPF